MHLDTKNTVSLSELIHWVKKELFSDEAFKDDPIPLFVIDEVTVEVNFVLSGESEGGFDLQVVKADAKVSEERVQKAIIKMKPLVPYERVRERLGEKNLKHFEDRSVRVILKGQGLDLPEQGVPTRK